MHEASKELIGKCVVVYLDDIIVFSKNRKERKLHLRQTLDTLRQHQLVAKPSKCDFFKTELLFLGHIISAGGIEPDPAKVEAITKMPPLRTLAKSVPSLA